jgi:hypothetical protein
MLKLKGLYEWELTNSDGIISEHGSQWNIISDRLIELMFRQIGSSNYCLFDDGMSVLLSDTTPTAGVDYRKAGAANGFNILATGDTDIGTGYVNWTLGTKYCDYNFTPPAVTPRTIRVIGIKVFSGSNDAVPTPNFVSFIELSTPITQNTNQYLYVKYTIFIAFDKTIGYNVPNNRYIEYAFNQCAFSYQMLRLGQRFTTNNVTSCSLTPFISASSMNNVERSVYTLYSTTAVADISALSGSPYGTSFLKSFAVGDIPGPIGSIVNQINYNTTTDSGYQYMNNIYGYSQVKGVTGSISRVFVHPSTRDAYIFSDPSYPATSQGTVGITGDATNKYPVVGRIRITKTGDATDLTDETVSYAAVDTGTSQVTIAQNFATGDMYQATTTGTLPNPLSLLTNYYIIWKDSTHIQLATTYANSLAGTNITLTTQGTGDHTFVRQNTGEYRLEMEPWSYGTTTPFYLSQLPMGHDIDGYIMPIDLTNVANTPNNYGEGDNIANTNYTYQNELFAKIGSYMIRGAAKNGNYIYTVQQSRKGLINNVCRWLFNSIETSQPLCKFGTGTTKVVNIESTATKMYIATTDGIYQYTYSSPTGAPALMTITGGIGTTITDMCIDPVTGYMWTGHETGLSKIDLGSLTATQYINGTGNALDGLSTNDVTIQPGQLSAYNGRVLRSGQPCVSNHYDYYGIAWVMNDGIGWYKVNGSTLNYGGCIDIGTNKIMLRMSTTIAMYTVVVTGKGTGSSTLVESQSATSTANGSVSNFTKMLNNTFVGLISSSSAIIQVDTYVVGYAPVPYTLVNVGAVSYGTGAGWTYGAFNHHKIDVDENGLYGVIWNNFFITPSLPNPVTYGWTGATWTKDFVGNRSIPKTAAHTLLNGLSVNFNNAVGSSWDTQFVYGDSFNFVHGPYRIKDNLQTLALRDRSYYCTAVPVESYSASIPAATSYTILIPESSGPNFRDMDNVDFVTEVYEGATRYTAYTLPTGSTFTVVPATDILTVGTSIATGTPVNIVNTNPAGNYLTPFPLINEGTYFAINISPTTCKLAYTYADAIAGTAIDITTAGTGTNYIKQVVPTAGTYHAGTTGLFVFSSTDAGKSLTLTYTYTLYN